MSRMHPLHPCTLTINKNYRKMLPTCLRRGRCLFHNVEAIFFRDREAGFFCQSKLHLWRCFRCISTCDVPQQASSGNAEFVLIMSKATAGWGAMPWIRRKLCTVFRNSCDWTLMSAFLRSFVLEIWSATSCQRQGNMLANKPQLARPVNKYDMSLAL